MVSTCDCGPTGHRLESASHQKTDHLDFPPVHIKDPIPLVKMSRASCPGGRFPPSLIHQVGP